MILDKNQLLEIYKTLPSPLRDGDGVTRLHGEPMQDPTELFTLIQRLNDNPPLNTIIELGRAHGGGLKVWEQTLPQNKASLLISVDNSLNVLWNWKNSPVNIQCIIGDTRAEESWQQVKNILKGEKADFLFIDASHWPKDVEHDFVWYGSFIREYGIIALHDSRLCRSFWNNLTGTLDSGDAYLTDPAVAKVEHDVFWIEEIKNSTGTAIFHKLPNQTLIKFRD